MSRTTGLFCDAIMKIDEGMHYIPIPGLQEKLRHYWEQARDVIDIFLDAINEAEHNASYNGNIVDSFPFALTL